MGYVRVQPRKWPGKQDEYRLNEFKQEIQVIIKRSGIDIWVCDETGFEGAPQPRQIICRRGEKPRVSYFGNHLMTSVLGGVRPADGKFTSLMMPYVDSEIFQYFIKELNKEVNPRKRNILLMDRAKWHLAKKIRLGYLRAEVFTRLFSRLKSDRRIMVGNKT